MTDAKTYGKRVEVKCLPSDTTGSAAINWKPPLPPTLEPDALEQLTTEYRRHFIGESDPNGRATRQVLNFDLDLFEIYGSPGGKRSDTYASLHTFNPEVTQLSLNGFVSCGTTRLYIQNAALLSYSVEGYDDPDDEPVSIYLQTKQASRDRTYEIWFQLSGRPANGYKRFHDTFVWISTFGKHFIDFLGSYPGSTIGLRHFREDFFKWLKLRYNDGAYFRKWHKVFGKSDFRGQVNAYRDYLYGQAYNLENRDDLLRHQVWADCMVGGRLAIQQQPAKCHNTTTTPFVYEFFKDMYFGYCLENMDPVEAVLKELEGRKRELGFAKDSIQQSSLSQAPEEIHDLPLLRVGDVIGVPPDTYGPHRQSDEDWLAYIHRIEPLENGVQKLYVLWLYRPCDTVIRGTTYPIAKEVFMSDNCNDGDSEAALFSTEVLRVYSVEWWPQNLNTTKDLIIRQKYITQENSFVTLKRSDLSCECATPPTIDKYQPGDTIYIKRRGLLEPVVIQKINADSTVSVRILLRLKRDCLKISGISISHKVAENELVWTNEIEEVHVNEFKRKCHIRFFEKNIIINGNVPLPYNRRGNGDFWILSSKLVKADEQYERVELLSTAPHLLTQGPDLATPSPKRLIGLGIFSGSGNFDRGLEEGGAIDFRYSVDFSPEAIHTQRMNAKDPKKLCLYCGSVDDNLKAVLTGKNSKLIARIGTVHFICGGSPCPGFSILQLDPFGERSCRNASHITTICSYVDVYRPQYAVFENVVNMSVTRKGYESQNVFENVVACFVAMGYQVQYLIADAWSYSSSQSRERLCISIAAPGLEPMMHPWHSHSHPETVKARSLGKQFDGVSFGEREEHDVPFDFVTAGVSTSDLPDIGSGVTHACIPFPDHRLGASMSIKDRLIARCIPTFPPGQGYAEALARGLIPEAGNKVMAEVGRSFRRIKVDGLFPTITTNISVQNSRASGCLHWDQPRAISIQEARRAQGFPDSEVIIGSPIEQLKQVGNAVDRNVALALGLALRYAWDKSCATKPTSQHLPTPVHAPADMQESLNNVSDVLASNKYVDNQDLLALRLGNMLKNSIVNSVASAMPTSQQPTPSLKSTKRQRGDGSDDKGAHSSVQNAHSRKKIKQSEIKLVVSMPVPQKAKELVYTHQKAYIDGKTKGSLPARSNLSNEDGALGSSKQNEVTNRMNQLDDADEREEIESVERPRPRFTDQAPTPRKTRQSGASVDFMPKEWNKRPESLVRPRK